MPDDTLKKFNIHPEDEVDIIHEVNVVISDTPAALTEEERIVTLKELKNVVTRKLKEWGARRVSWRIKEEVSLDTIVTHFIFSRYANDVYLLEAPPKEWSGWSDLGTLRIEPSLYRDFLLDVLADEGIKYSWDSQ